MILLDLTSLYQKVAEAYEAELERRLNQVEERLKPPIMRFTEKLNQTNGVDETLAEEIVCEVEDPNRIVSIMKNKASSMEKMTRSQLVGFIKTIINLRDRFLEEEIRAGSDVMQVRISLLEISMIIRCMLRKWPVLFSNTWNVPPSSGMSSLTGRPWC